MVRQSTDHPSQLYRALRWIHIPGRCDAPSGCLDVTFAFHTLHGRIVCGVVIVMDSLPLVQCRDEDIIAKSPALLLGELNCVWSIHEENIGKPMRLNVPMTFSLQFHSEI